MNTYKFGNKVKCIIRSFSSGNIGDDYMQYNNQPYTVLKDIDASITFKSTEVRNTNRQTFLAFQEKNIEKIELSSVCLTDKILNLIYAKNEEKLCNTVENLTSTEDKKLFLNTNAEMVYQVFIYDSQGKLEKAYGSYDLNDPILVENSDEPYLVFYSYEGSMSVSLDKTTNHYLTLDLEIVGSTNENNNNLWVHIEKCVLIESNSLSFTNTTNSVTLTFEVLESDHPNYITF